MKTTSTIISIPSHIQGLLFDCDGTLVDSMPLHMQAWEASLKYFQAPYDRDFFFSRKGMKETVIVDEYNKTFGASLDSSAVVERKHYYFRDHIEEVRPIKPVVDVVFRYDSVLPMAVVSGGQKEIVEGELRVVGLVHYFQEILTADDPYNPKPAPDLFLEAARRITVEPSACMVFEDGDLGIRAAHNAGMGVIDIRPLL